jgi:predicted molibdopterin-dependent oxidoreductase YjgC
MVKLKIDGKEIETRQGATILEAARASGIYIPTLCFHENLLPIGSCRLCVVEVEGYTNPMASCDTAAAEGMVIRTQSDRLRAMRQDYLKLILAYHPLDCPICDAGGECDLQDLVFEHKIEKADLTVHRDKLIDAYATPLIKYWENRCVLCLRCIHACREISGRGVLDLVGTGIDARMAPTNARNCISCGECLFVCPVGALTEALSPLKARPWQIERRLTTCPHCGFGCTFELDVFEGRRVTDVIQDVRNQPNKGSLCVLGRFGYDFVNHEARLQEAASKGEPLPLYAAVEAAYDALRKLDEEGKGIGFVVSPRATNEEIFMIRQIAGRFRKASLSTSGHYHTGKVRNAFARMGISPVYEYHSLVHADLILIAGANLLSNNHVLADRVREAVKLRGAKIIVVDPSPTALSGLADVHAKVRPAHDAFLFNAVSRRLIDEGAHPTKKEIVEGFVSFFSALKPFDVKSALEQSAISADTFDKMYRMISRAANMAVIFGSGISAFHESLRGLLNMCVLKGIDRKGLIMPVAREANALGAVSILDSTSSPHRIMEDKDIKGLFFFEDDPFHYVNGDTMAGLLKEKEFVLVADALPTHVMDHADLVVPTGVFIEKEGTFFAEDGYVRKVRKMTPGASWKGFEFLQGLLARLGGERYLGPAQVTERLREAGIIAGGNGREKLGTEAQVSKFDARPIPQSLPEGTDYLLMLRDVCINHHIIDKEAYSQGVSIVYAHPGFPISEDKLNMSPEDAASLKVSEGDIIEVESQSGLVQKPVSIKEGLKKGVLEYLVFKDRQQALRLSASPAKWIEVKVRKG